MYTQTSIFAKYCSDFTYRGICGYRDEAFFCGCDEGSLEKPLGEREGMQKVMDFVTQQGLCIIDSVSLSGPIESHAFHLVIPCLRCHACMLKPVTYNQLVQFRTAINISPAKITDVVPAICQAGLIISALIHPPAPVQLAIHRADFQISVHVDNYIPSHNVYGH